MANKTKVVVIDGVTYYPEALKGKSESDLSTEFAHLELTNRQVQDLHARFNPAGEGAQTNDSNAGNLQGQEGPTQVSEPAPVEKPSKKVK